jgi:hypothetical protein
LKLIWREDAIIFGDEGGTSGERGERCMFNDVLGIHKSVSERLIELICIWIKRVIPNGDSRHLLVVSL